MKKKNVAVWMVVAAFMAVVLGLYAPPVISQMSGTGFLFVTGNGNSGSYVTPGGYFTYGSGITDFVSSNTGTAGTFAWGEEIAGGIPVWEMTLSGTTLTVPQVAGNAATATQLAISPTTCSGGQTAMGIEANGNAICRNTTTALDQWITFSSTCGSGQVAYNGDASCVGTATFTPAMADTSYYVQCQDSSGPHVSSSSWGVVFFSASASTASSISYQQGEIWGNGATSGASMDTPVTVVCHLHHN